MHRVGWKKNLQFCSAPTCSPLFFYVDRMCGSLEIGTSKLYFWCRPAFKHTVVRASCTFKKVQHLLSQHLLSPVDNSDKVHDWDEGNKWGRVNLLAKQKCNRMKQQPAAVTASFCTLIHSIWTFAPVCYKWPIRTKQKLQSSCSAYSKAKQQQQQQQWWGQCSSTATAAGVQVWVAALIRSTYFLLIVDSDTVRSAHQCFVPAGGLNPTETP
jgi:hypothetical protein